MRRTLIILFALLVVAVVAYTQQIPNTTQGTRSNMTKGPHDFTVDSSASTLKGSSNSTCAYCHAMHIPQAEALDNTPLWSRRQHDAPASYGVYSSPTLSATLTDVAADNNYSRLCMNCHDGTTALFAASSYIEGKRPRDAVKGVVGDTTSHMPAEFVFGPGGQFTLSHVHPVNFSYDNTLVTADGGLFSPVSASLAYSGGVGANLRLFDGKMQCSTCHNAHMSSPIGTYMSSSQGKLCIACHKK